ncbi:MAG TPA: BamA/TamA family outer membrane protein [Bacillota bacterium]|nr:BamA/TamA family outer membrane protein [Bacillota bacterium]
MKYIKGIGIVVIAAILLTVGLPAFADTTPKVLMIEVQGNSQVSSDKVLGEVTNTIIGGTLNATALQMDMQRIMATGYFANVQVNTEKFFDGVKVIFVVVENPVLKEIKISGLTNIKPEDILKHFRQKPGEVFNVTFFREDLSKALKAAQTEKGLFIEPRSNNLNISSDGIVQVELVELKVGKIKITGLEKTKDFVVRRELTLKEGEVFDESKLKNDYMRLMQLRLFDNIEVKFEKSAIPEALDVVFEFVEAQTGSFNFGISYTQSTKEIGGLLTYSESNLMGLGQTLSLDLNLGEDEDEIRFTFQEPWLDEHHTSFTLSMWNSDAETTSTLSKWLSNSASFGLYDMDLNRTGLSLSFGRPWKNMTAKIKFNFERNEIEKYWKHDEDEPENGLPMTDLDLRSTDFWNNSVELQLVKNRLVYKNRFSVKSGYQLSGSYSVAGGYIGGEFDYQTAMLEGKWFHSLSDNLVLATRLQGAYLTGDFPDYDALYLGGTNRLRGYRDRRYSDDSTMELIGTRYVLSNTELRYQLPFHKDMELVVFYDVGQVKNLSNDNVTKSDYGFGIRYNVPYLGMIRIDQAWNSDGDSRVVFGMQESF